MNNTEEYIYIYITQAPINIRKVRKQNSSNFV